MKHAIFTRGSRERTGNANTRGTSSSDSPFDYKMSVPVSASLGRLWYICPDEQPHTHQVQRHKHAPSRVASPLERNSPGNRKYNLHHQHFWFHDTGLKKTIKKSIRDDHVRGPCKMSA